MIELTKLGNGYNIKSEYTDNAGDVLLMLLDANEFINANTGNCVTIDGGNGCNFFSKPIDFASL
jgi:hypothetical protein